MTLWEQLEEWLHDTLTFGGTFTNRQLADALDISGDEATALIRSYLDAQRSSRTRTLYVIHRTGRTARAVWHVGMRTADAREASHQYFDDVRLRFVRAVEPDLAAIAARNPRAARKCEAIIEAVGDSAMKLLQVAVDGLDVDDEP